MVPPGWVSGRGKLVIVHFNRLAVKMTLDLSHSFPAEEIHAWFRRRHSFEARLIAVSRATQQDLSLGKAPLNQVESERAAIA